MRDYFGSSGIMIQKRETEIKKLLAVTLLFIYRNMTC